ncbi:aldose 1-epimerase [Striga asiatica]|uniref:Aldose 1-epimerase n=1 Tax=Striga asiatica TaxID=4170 RepID=A0A5A7QYH2_STRAF|nr:aldose 1-epimerase [Striga asiatica]
MSKFSIILLISFMFLVLAAIANNIEYNGLGFYEIKKGNFSVKITNYGARIVSVVLPDKNAIVGRVANRIAGAKFTLNGTVYKLDANEGNNMLHGFPGDVVASVTYALLGPNKLSMKMKAQALNKPTPVNLAQHTYWNLAGHNSGNILSDELQIFASHFTPVGKGLIPTGEISPVESTPYDFLKARAIKGPIKKLPEGSKGFDINYVVDGPNGPKMKPVAVVYSKKSGRVMKLSANAPGVQLYTGNYVHDLRGKGGFVYEPHSALCLETQGFPDSVNHPNFPSQIVFPGKCYKHYMLYSFSIKK